MTEQGRAYLDTSLFKNRKREIALLLNQAGARGLSEPQVRNRLHEKFPSQDDVNKNHQGAVGGALSKMHEEGHLVRLVEKRLGGGIYMVAGLEGTRETAPHQKQHGDNSGHVKAAGLRDVIEDCLQVLDDPRKSMVISITAVEKKLQKALKDFA